MFGFLSFLTPKNIIIGITICIIVWLSIWNFKLKQEVFILTESNLELQYEIKETNLKIQELSIKTQEYKEKLEQNEHKIEYKYKNIIKVVSDATCEKKLEDIQKLFKFYNEYHTTHHSLEQ